MTFPLGNIRSFLGYGEPQEAPNTTKNTSLVSAVAETVLTSVTPTFNFTNIPRNCK